MLNGIDYLSNIQFNSDFGKFLNSYQSQTSINPMDFKKFLQIMLSQKPDCLDIDNLMVEEQCVRDFFILLSGYKQEYKDVFDTFKHKIIQHIKCPNCNLVSTKEIIQLYMEENVPDNNASLKTYLERLFNESQIAEDYLCECGSRNNCEKKMLFDSKTSSNFLIVILLRVNVSYFDINKQEQVHINTYGNEVDATQDIQIVDVNGSKIIFEPIGVIPHLGHVSGKVSSGHYICDIRLKNFNWYRTNDDKKSIALNKNMVTRKGYVILYKRKYLKTKHVDNYDPV